MLVDADRVVLKLRNVSAKELETASLLLADGDELAESTASTPQSSSFLSSTSKVAGEKRLSTNPVARMCSRSCSHQSLGDS